MEGFQLPQDHNDDSVPKVSIITVAFNSAATVRDTIESVFFQNYSSIEHIIIDGGSTDSTMKIIKSFYPNLAHVISESDKGIYDAMNKGLDIATGDVVCFLNSDDKYASDNVISNVVTRMQKHQLDALITDVGFFYPSAPEKIVRRYRSNRFTPERLAWGWMPAHPGLFLRKHVVDRVGRFKTDYKIAGDYEYIIRAFCGQNLKYQHLSEIVVKMQTGGASTAGLRAKIQLNKEVLRACRENGIKTNCLKILSKYPEKLLETIIK